MEIWKTFLLFCALAVTVTRAIMTDKISSFSIVVDAYKNAFNNLRRVAERYAKTLKDQVNVGMSIVSSACKKEVIRKLLKAEEDTLTAFETELQGLRYECTTAPPGVEHATVDVTKFNVTHQVAKYRCNNGYTYGGGNKEVLCDSDYGVWNLATLQCIALRYECTAAPPGVEHATVDVTKFNVTHQVAKYRCNNGYIYGGGNKEILCDSDYGVWNSATLQCIECFTTASTYQGNKNITQGGIECQRWDSQSPHKHYVESSFLPDQEISSAENYCRAPKFSEPWCYTADPKLVWDYCGIPKCNRKNEKDCGLPQSLTNAKPLYTYTSTGARASYVCLSLSGSTQKNYCPVSQCTETGWTAVSISCSEHDCFRNSSEYTGKRSCTISGRTCQVWTEMYPQLNRHEKGPFPDSSSANAANYCRDPDGSGSPWCYITDSNVRYEFCDVPRCDGML